MIDKNEALLFMRTIEEHIERLDKWKGELQLEWQGWEAIANPREYDWVQYWDMLDHQIDQNIANQPSVECEISTCPYAAEKDDNRCKDHRYC